MLVVHTTFLPNGKAMYLAVYVNLEYPFDSTRLIENLPRVVYNTW